MAFCRSLSESAPPLGRRMVSLDSRGAARSRLRIRGYLRGGGGSGASVGPSPGETGSAIPISPRLRANRFKPASGATTPIVHAFIEAQCPGAHGPRPGWAGVSLPSGVVGTGTLDSDATGPEPDFDSPRSTMDCLECEARLCPIPPWAAHAAPLPSNVSCRRRTLERAAVKRRPSGMSCDCSGSLAFPQQYRAGVVFAASEEGANPIRKTLTGS
jgi:hypothetical protein